MNWSTENETRPQQCTQGHGCIFKRDVFLFVPLKLFCETFSDLASIYIDLLSLVERFFLLKLKIINLFLPIIFIKSRYNNFPS